MKAYLTLTTVLLLLLSEASSACMYSPLAAAARDPAGEMNRRDFAFYGQVVRYEPIGLPEEVVDVFRNATRSEVGELYRKYPVENMRVVFAVTQVWKGQVATSFEALNRVDTSCSFHLRKGDWYIIFGSNHLGRSRVSSMITGDQVDSAVTKLERGY